MRRFSHYLFIFLLVTATLVILVQGVALASKHPPAKHVVSRGAPEGSRDVTAGCASNPNPQNCDHHDPANPDEGCTDKETLTGEDIFFNGSRIGHVEIRFSQACQSAWTRVMDTDGTNIGSIDAFITRTLDNAYDESAGGPLVNGYKLYSNMLFGVSGSGTQFCALGAVDGINPPGGSFCVTV
jgi:Protein of unknown function (DUF2690)